MNKKVTEAFDEKVYLLGKGKDGLWYWLEAPSWDCDWYWGFGYVETYTNNKYPEHSVDIVSHQHFDNLFLKNNIYDSFTGFFEETVLTEKEIWELLEYMQEAYILKRSAELFKNGSAGITGRFLSDFQEKLKDRKEYDKINKVLLPTIFEKVDKLLSPSD